MFETEDPKDTVQRHLPSLSGQCLPGVYSHRKGGVYVVYGHTVDRHEAPVDALLQGRADAEIAWQLHWVPALRDAGERQAVGGGSSRETSEQVRRCLKVTCALSERR